MHFHGLVTWLDLQYPNQENIHLSETTKFYAIIWFILLSGTGMR